MNPVETFNKIQMKKRLAILGLLLASISGKGYGMNGCEFYNPDGTKGLQFPLEEIANKGRTNRFQDPNIGKHTSEISRDSLERSIQKGHLADKMFLEVQQINNSASTKRINFILEEIVNSYKGNQKFSWTLLENFALGILREMQDADLIDFEKLKHSLLDFAKISFAPSELPLPPFIKRSSLTKPKEPSSPAKLKYPPKDMISSTSTASHSPDSLQVSPNDQPMDKQKELPKLENLSI